MASALTVLIVTAVFGLAQSFFPMRRPSNFGPPVCKKPYGYKSWGQSETSENSWPKVCQTGKKQSPIHISQQAASLNNTEDLSFDGYGSGSTTNYVIINNGKTIMIRFTGAAGKGPRLSYAGRTYQFLQLHFHWPAEHVFNGQRLPLEMHLVHQEVDSDKLLVITVLHRLGSNSNEMISKISSILRVVEDPTKKERFAGKPKISLEKFLPAGLDKSYPSYYSYEGSLTTPPCTEGVRFIILFNPSRINTSDLHKFERVRRCHPRGFVGWNKVVKWMYGNFRQTQDLNGRRVSLHTDLLF